MNYKKKQPRRDSNPQPSDSKSAALPLRHSALIEINLSFFVTSKLIKHTIIVAKVFLLN